MSNDEEFKKRKEHAMKIAEAGNFHWRKGNLEDLKVAEKLMEATLLSLDCIGEDHTEAYYQMRDRILVDIRTKIKTSEIKH